MKKFAVIVAGGSGVRMGAQIPKQFLELKGMPVLMHTLQLFYNYDPEMELILVLPENQHQFWSELCLKHAFGIGCQMVSGGDTRFHSVKNGLKLVSPNSVVFIHDGVRPLVRTETIERCYQVALLKGNAIPVMPVSDSLRKCENERNSSVDRSLFVSVQTPQTFRSELILEAFRQDYDPSFTDDASVLEKTGAEIFLTAGNPENIKITNPGDLIIAEAFLSL